MAASSQLLYHLFRPPQPQPPPPPSSFLSLFLGLKPLFLRSTASTTTTLSKSSLPKIPLRTTTHLTNYLPTPLSSQSFAILTPSHLPAYGASSALQAGEISEEDDDDEDFEDEIEKNEENDGVIESGSEDSELGGTGGETSQGTILNSSLPGLSVKEKKELASYAHSLGKKLKSQLVGKSGVTANVATSFIETLEANELLKVPINKKNYFVSLLFSWIGW